MKKILFSIAAILPLAFVVGFGQYTVPTYSAGSLGSASAPVFQSQLCTGGDSCTGTAVAGDYILLVYAIPSANTVTSCQDSTNGSYGSAIRTTVGAYQRLSAYGMKITTGGSLTFSCTPNTGGSDDFYVLRATGASAVDASQSSSGSGTVASITGVSTSAHVLGIALLEGASTPTTPGGWTQGGTFVSNYYSYNYYQTFASANGSNGVSITINSSNYDLIFLTLKP